VSINTPWIPFAKNKMNRPRTRQRIVGPAVLRLWNFHPEHIRDGPADGVPITITARPRYVFQN